MKKCAILIVFVFPAMAFAASATVSVDYSSEINYFSPAAVFGVNSAQWEGYGLVKLNSFRYQHAGMRYIRFPGGSHSNEYHWNADGYYDAEKIWHVNGSPAPATFGRGFTNVSEYRGSTSPNYGKKAFVTDTSLSTSWKSFAGETTPQWIYLNLQTVNYMPVACDRVVIEWGAPYAAQYKVQYSNAAWPGALDAYVYNDTAWKDTSLGTITGAGGHADHSFTPITGGIKYLRILCLTPSSGTQYEIKDIKAYNGTVQVSVNSDQAWQQTKSVSSSVSLGDHPDYTGNMDFEQFMSVCRMLTPPAEPLITINFFTGTTQEAKDWVYYANVHKNYGIKYWEIGNENSGNWEAGGPVSPEFYGKRFIDFYDAMKEADGSISVIPQFSSATDPWNVTCSASWNPAAKDYYIESFLKYVQARGRADIVKEISVHCYPSYMPASEAEVLGKTGLWDADLSGTGRLNDWINTYCGGPSNTRIWLTEYNDGIDSQYTNNYYNSLFIPAFMLNYVKNGGDFGFLFVDFGSPGVGQGPGLYSDLGAIESGVLSGQYAQFRNQPRSSYWGIWMLNNRFSAADELGNTLVAASSSLASLRVYANKRGDRKLSVMLVNTSKTDDASVTLNLSNFTPLASAGVMTFSPQHYSWIPAQLQSHADPDLQPSDSAINNAATSFAVNVPAYNIRIITMYDALRETLTPSNTPTHLPDPTNTPTPPSPGSVMLDDCEDGDIVDLWGGTWSIYGDGVSSYPVTIPDMTCGEGAAEGGCHMKVTGTVLAGAWGYGVNVPLNAAWSGVDISEYDGVFFSYKGDGGGARVGFPQADVAMGAFGVEFEVNTYWAYYQMPFSSLTYPSWGDPGAVWTAGNIKAVQFQPPGGSGSSSPVYREMNVDSIGFYKNTPTVTPTAVMTSPDLKNVKVFPQPCNMTGGACKGVTFKNLSAWTNLRIFTLNGGLVYRIDEATPSGEYFWDLAAYKKSEAIAPGLYLYIIMNEDKEVARGRIAIIR